MFTNKKQSLCSSKEKKALSVLFVCLEGVSKQINKHMANLKCIETWSRKKDDTRNNICLANNYNI